MKILIADRGGYCYGVQRALDIAMEAAQTSQGPIHTLGPIIHNPGVVSRLAKAGVSPVEKPDDVSGGTVILRTHGVSPQVIEEIVSRGAAIVDATCPYVKVAQEKASLLKEQGYLPVILGEHEHPEVVALAAHAGEGAIIVENVEELDEVMAAGTIKGKVGVVVQTTQSSDNLSKLCEKLAPATRELLVYNTMCNATQKCQDEALGLAGEADVVIVIGGRNSANTTRLAQLCRLVQPKTHHVEEAGELQEGWFAGASVVAVTAGASTPPEQLEEAARMIREWGADRE